MQRVDYIIVGQGLAGSCLALRLLMCGKKVAVIDEGNPHAASRVAAGLFNPVTGKMPALTWMASELFSSLAIFYTEAEKYTRTSFYHPMPVYRPFISLAEQYAWMEKATAGEMDAFIQKIHHQQAFAEEVTNPYGGIELRQCGYINTANFLKAVKKVVAEQGIFMDEAFRESELRLASGYVQYSHLEAGKIVFCTGVSCIRLFDFVPIRPLKGEVLKLQSSHRPQCIYNRGVYVVPEVWIAGATYTKADQTCAITGAARTQLERGLNALIRFPCTITGQDYGFRPTLPDRRPVLGRHPQYPHVYIFNGLGTKGVSLAPYFSAQLLNYMENGVPLNQIVDVKRYIFR
ncbi:MAG: FAD-dependent oxidoreductase [Cyclobacteriaceae bacterium]|nr:MAG: FAD-dependent oxidoreductase [Cyclobacteriaceae bacterium]